jgi:hypothetical protein
MAVKEKNQEHIEENPDQVQLREGPPRQSRDIPNQASHSSNFPLHQHTSQQPYSSTFYKQKPPSIAATS